MFVEAISGGSNDGAKYAYGDTTYGNGTAKTILTASNKSSDPNYYKNLLEDSTKYAEVNLGFKPKSIVLFPASAAEGASRQPGSTLMIFNENNTVGWPRSGSASAVVNDGDDYYGYSTVCVKFTDTGFRVCGGYYVQKRVAIYMAISK